MNDPRVRQVEAWRDDGFAEGQGCQGLAIGFEFWPCSRMDRPRYAGAKPEIRDCTVDDCLEAWRLLGDVGDLEFELHEAPTQLTKAKWPPLVYRAESNISLSLSAVSIESYFST